MMHVVEAVEDEVVAAGEVAPSPRMLLAEARRGSTSLLKPDIHSANRLAEGAELPQDAVVELICAVGCAPSRNEPSTLRLSPTVGRGASVVGSSLGLCLATTPEPAQ
eukprot:scaffold193690_cov28-Tisochrysis_lutea.AAC.1